jgi:hypothetical protein
MNTPHRIDLRQHVALANEALIKPVGYVSRTAGPRTCRLAEALSDVRTDAIRHVRRALQNSSTFSSAFGVMMNEDMNQLPRGNTLCSDGAEHQRLRRLITSQLRGSPRFDRIGRGKSSSGVFNLTLVRKSQVWRRSCSAQQS